MRHERRPRKVLVRAVADRVGLATTGRWTADGESGFLDMAPAGAEPAESFSVRFRTGWRSAEAAFVPGAYAADLIVAMGGASDEGRLTFAALAGGLAGRRLKLAMNVNGVAAQPAAPSIWPAAWNRLDLSLKRTPVFIGEDDGPGMETLAAELVVPMFALLVALIGVEDAPVEPSLPAFAGEPEGRPFQTLVTRYERKGANREACIQLRGRRCHACRFDFARFYGPLGAGYIEVHHVVPVSRMGAGYMVDPSTDLLPLCANCHAMVHRTDPPMPVEELARLIAANRPPGHTPEPDDGHEGEN